MVSKIFVDTKVLSFYNDVEEGLIFIVEKILEMIINEMVPHLGNGQLEHLSNVLYVNFHGMEIQEQSTGLSAAGMDGDAAKIKMFVASKKAVNRQDNTLKQYTREILNMLNLKDNYFEIIPSQKVPIIPI